MIELESLTGILGDLHDSINDINCESTFIYIEEFKSNFEKDYINEEKRIKNQFNEIRRSIDSLEKIQLDALRKSKDEFLKNRFENIFKEADITKKYYNFYKESKNLCKKKNI
jgi:esterase/lipase